MDENISSSLAEMPVSPQAPVQDKETKDKSPGNARAMLGNSLSSDFFKKIKTGAPKAKKDEEVIVSLFMCFTCE